MTPRDRALEEHLADRRYREMFDTNTAIKLLIDPETGAIVDANRAACTFYGRARDELRSMRIQDINTLPPERVAEEMERAKSEQRLYFQFQHRLASGAVRDVDVYTGPVTFGGRRLLHSIIIDMTARRELERQLLRAQRMDTIGRLAGGIAHDFNNALTAIMGSASIALGKLEGEHPAREWVEEIVEMGARAGEITRQLLSLARLQVVQPGVVALDEIIVQTDRLLRRVIGEDVELAVVLRDAPVLAEVDPAQIEQLLVNLAVNAREAMPRGGTLRIETERKTIPPEAARAPVPPGEWAVLRVADDGPGIPDAIQGRVFEPFFTTKAEGTGLGLTICQSVVERAEGHLRLVSAAGEGTVFEIWLPAADARRAAASRRPAPGASTGARVLLVEDDPRVQAVVAAMIRALGHEVSTAGNGAEALALLDGDSPTPEVLVTDVVMPLLGGPELVRRVRERHPHLPVLFVSGYAAGGVPADTLDARTRFLAKPFTESELGAAVGELVAVARQ